MNRPVPTYSSLRLLTICAALPFCLNGQNPPVPSAYQAIYAELQADLGNFNTTLNANGVPPTYTGMQCGSLEVANSNNGPGVLNSNPTQQLLAFQAMGVPCIELNVSFPLLYEPFMTGQGQSQSAFLSFYATLANQIHSMGMKVVVENEVLLSTGALNEGWDTSPFYATLSWADYEQARATTAQTIALGMVPDYLVVMEEPDTEASNTGQTQVGTPVGANTLLSIIAAGLQTSRQNGMRIGAGVGTWLLGFEPFIQGYVTQPIDFIDLHIYPINYNDLSNTLDIANIAAAAHMPVAVSECWLNKEADSEMGTIGPDQIASRNVFSFWSPLDEYFIQTVQNTASYVQTALADNVLFLDPADSEYFFASLDYNDSTSGLPPTQLISEENAAAAQANAEGTYQSTGMFFYHTVVLTPDTVAPTTPSNLTGSSNTPNTVVLTWNASSDNVGVAGYQVSRNGVLIGTTDAETGGSFSFQDNGLTGGTSTTYYVRAFDLAGNVSAPATVSTIVIEPPPPVIHLTVTSISYTRATLTWTVSSSEPVSSYAIYLGLTPTTLIQVAILPGSATSYTCTNLTAGTTYYAGLTAFIGGMAVPSSPVAFTTFPLPTAPTGLGAVATSATRVVLTWSPSVGGLPITSYKVFRGLSPTALTLIATTNKVSYNDATLSPATTYYYAVAAVAPGPPPVMSPLSPTVSVTTYPLPNPPGNVTVTPIGSGKLSITWTAPTNGLPIARYFVYRGTSPDNMTQVATVPSTRFVDVNLTSHTTYYYGVVAQDKGIPPDLSAMSPPVAGTTN